MNEQIVFNTWKEWQSKFLDDVGSYEQFMRVYYGVNVLLDNNGNLKNFEIINERKYSRLWDHI